MTTITIHFKAQLKNAAKIDKRTIDLPESAIFTMVIDYLKSNPISELNKFLFNPQGDLSKSLLFTLNNSTQIKPADNPPLKDGDVISVFSPISGG